MQAVCAVLFSEWRLHAVHDEVMPAFAVPPTVEYELPSQAEQTSVWPSPAQVPAAQAEHEPAPGASEVCW
jgi:hypothetical protein